MRWSNVGDYADDRDLAIAHLGQALYRGELALLLGAGVSCAFGFPGWIDLVRRCLTLGGLDPASVKDNASFDATIETIGKLRHHLGSDSAYHLLVKNALYQSAEDRSTSNPTRLLLALGALLMGSKRGKIREVWTLNFDDVLEWYLRLHGFVSQVVTEIPTVLREVDVTIYHPHGFLPLDTRNFKNSKGIVFDDKAYAKRFVGNDPWGSALDYALKSKIFLAIGLSWSDLALKSLIIESADINSDRPTAFWFFGGPPADSKDAAENCIRHNVVPIQLASHNDYPTFILKICEAAMNHGDFDGTKVKPPLL